MFQAVSYGTIPYLGTFLTDLTMIDTAIPDTVSNGLINFDKKRKEFEVLAQVSVSQAGIFVRTNEENKKKKQMKVKSFLDKQINIECDLLH